MKTTTSRKTNLIVLFFLIFFSAITIQAQVAINTSGNPPHISAMLDVDNTTTSMGVLIPRIAWATPPVASPVQGLLIYVNAGAPPHGFGFYYFDSGTWKKLLDGGIPLGVTKGGTGTTTQFGPGSVVFAGSGGVYSEDNSNFFWDNTNKWLGLGINYPNSNLHVFEANNDILPAVVIEQYNHNIPPTTGDASLLYKLIYPNDQITEITTGIDYDDNSNFEISTTSGLSGTAPGAYNDPTTMMRMHTENPIPGITDFNHQSRARVYLANNKQVISSSMAWIPINFNAQSYDEHGEFVTTSTPAIFTAIEEGYYQVNARTEFVDIEYDIFFFMPQYVSIAIFKRVAGNTNATIYAQGNKLQMIVVYNGPPENGVEPLYNNNAPNVSDVVYLQAGDQIEIHVYHEFLIASILNGQAITYASVHKIS